MEEKPKIKLSREQKSVFNQLESTNDNYFITGNAGTGKSVLLEYFLAHTKKSAVVLAPTGIAALNVGGQTIHSFFMIPPTNIHRGDPETHRRMSKNKLELIRNLDCLVIDEISMVSSALMDIIDDRLQFIRRNSAPFGGVQVIVFGDLYQLPPVIKSGDEEDYILGRYGTHFFFGAPAVEHSNFKIISLEHIFRQNDSAFINALNQIRTGTDISDALDVINSRLMDYPEENDFVTLTPYNYSADRINRYNLDKLDTKLYNCRAEMSGRIKASDSPAPELLSMKRGARVMLLKNDYESEKPRWVNGTFAEIHELSAKGLMITIGKKHYKLKPEKWENSHYEYDEENDENVRVVDGYFRQFPLRLAYAVTIHKSQGQTYDGLNLDLSRGAFAAGQTYVALSRCRTLEGLHLTTPLKESDILVDPAIIKYMNEKR